MRLRLDLEEAKLCIKASTQQATTLFERKGNYSVPYLRSIIQIAKENLEKEFNYPVSEYSDWYIVKCKMTDEEARQSEMEHRVFQINENHKIIELFTEELKKRQEMTLEELQIHMEHRKNSLKDMIQDEEDLFQKGIYTGMLQAYQELSKLLHV